MKFKKTKLKGVYIIEPDLLVDIRGFFFRAFCKKELAGVNEKFDIRQINRSLTKKKGTIRGLHFQKKPFEEGKIFQCLRGRIYAVLLDLRKGPSFGRWIPVEISEKNRKIVMIPKGVVVGIQTLTSNCEILYYMSQYYAPKFYSGIRWNDPTFKIKWPIKKPFISDQDKSWPDYII